MTLEEQQARLNALMDMMNQHTGLLAGALENVMPGLKILTTVVFPVEPDQTGILFCGNATPTQEFADFIHEQFVERIVKPAVAAKEDKPRIILQ